MKKYLIGLVLIAASVVFGQVRERYIYPIPTRSYFIYEVVFDLDDFEFDANNVLGIENHGKGRIWYSDPNGDLTSNSGFTYDDANDVLAVGSLDVNDIDVNDIDVNDLVVTGAITLSGSAPYAIDASSGTWSSGVMNWDANPDVYANGSKIIGFDDTNYNILAGAGAFSNDNGQYNVGIGYDAGANNNTTGGAAYGDQNVYIGSNAGKGSAAGNKNQGYLNVAIGNNALTSLTTGYNNFAIGAEALEALTEGNYNVAVGVQAGHAITNTDYNLFLGSAAGYNNIGSQNVAIGSQALYSSVAGATSGSVAIGYKAMFIAGTAGSDVCIGQEAGTALTTGLANVYIGYYAGRYPTTGGFNVGIGREALEGASGSSTSMTNNVAVGYQAGTAMTTGDYCVFLGNQAGVRQTTNDNLLIIDNQDRGSAAAELTDSMLYGVFNATVASQSLRVNAGTVTLNGGADTDLTINLTGTTNSGVVKWMEDEDYVEFDDDIVFSGDAVGLPYGDMYTNSTIAVVISDNNPTEIKDATDDGFTSGEVHRVTFPTGGDEHYLAVDVAGRYLANWSISCAQNTPAATIEIEGGVMVGGTAQNPGRAHRTVANSTDKGNMGGTCVLDLAANDQVSLFITNETNTTNIDVEHANLTLVHVGGT